MNNFASFQRSDYMTNQQTMVYSKNCIIPSALAKLTSVASRSRNESSDHAEKSMLSKMMKLQAIFCGTFHRLLHLIKCTLVYAAFSIN